MFEVQALMQVPTIACQTEGAPLGRSQTSNWTTLRQCPRDRQVQQSYLDCHAMHSCQRPRPPEKVTSLPQKGAFLVDLGLRACLSHRYSVWETCHLERVVAVAGMTMWETLVGALSVSEGAPQFLRR